MPEREPKKRFPDSFPDDLVGREAFFVVMTVSDFRSAEPDKLEKAKAAVTEPEIQREFQMIRQRVDHDQSLSGEYRQSFTKNKMQELAFMSAVLLRISYPDGKIPSAGEIEEKLLDDVFGKEKDK